MPDITYTTTWTTAPADYDGFGTTTRKVVGVDKMGLDVREVVTPTQHAQWQRMRFASGNYLVLTSASELADQKDFGLIVVL